MTELRFITDEQLRNMVERDRKELYSCFEHQLYKSTLLLAGSIIEAILVDFFLAFPRTNSTPQQILNANLADLIDWAEQDGLMTSRAKELSTVIRNYRNLIHPGREYRLKERVDVHTANVAVSLVEITIRDIADNYTRRLGYTAEQAIGKVRLDPSCKPIFQHMIDKMAPVERVKLFRSIPNECQTSDDVETIVQSFIDLHNLLKDSIPQEIVRVEASKVYDYVRNGSQRDAMFYLRFFSDNLDMLESDRKDTVVAYLLSILESEDGEGLGLYAEWAIFRGFGERLNPEESTSRLKKVVSGRLYNKTSEADTVFLRIFCEQVALGMDYDYIRAIIKFLAGMSWDKRALGWAEYIGENVLPF